MIRTINPQSNWNLLLLMVSFIVPHLQCNTAVTLSVLNTMQS